MLFAFDLCFFFLPFNNYSKLTVYFIISVVEQIDEPKCNTYRCDIQIVRYNVYYMNLMPDLARVEDVSCMIHRYQCFFYGDTPILCVSQYLRITYYIVHN